MKRRVILNDYMPSYVALRVRARIETPPMVLNEPAVIVALRVRARIETFSTVWALRRLSCPPREGTN